MNPLPGWLAPAAEFSAEFLILAAVFFVLERLRPVGGGPRDAAREIGVAALNACLVLPLTVFLFGPMLSALAAGVSPPHPFEPWILALPGPLRILFALFVMDLSTYWRHRLAHRYLWPFHAFHHSALRLTWTTAARLHPVEVLLATGFDATMLYLLGFDGPEIAVATLVMLAYNFFAHADLDLAYPPPFRWVFASPAYHRWHHATDRSAYDKNFCAMFSLLDLIFGTYHHPEGLPQAYGLSPGEQKRVPKGLAPHLLLPFARRRKT